MGEEEKRINVKSAFTTDADKIQTYFIEFKPFYGRLGLYVDPATGKDFPDNDERFILFCKGVLETLKMLFWQPDIIHCNDWQTSLVPMFLKTHFKEDEFFKKVSTVLTVHNVGFQGNYPKDSFYKIGLEEDVYANGDAAKHFDQFSFLKAGISFADHVTTVSKTYAEEVKNSKEYGFGLEDVFTSIGDRFSGIVNGIDYSVWNPEKDKRIEQTYTASTLSDKYKNKQALLEQFDLEYVENEPVIGMITRLTEQKGIDLLEEIAEDLLRLKVKLVIVGTGEKKYHDFLGKLQKKHKDKIAVKLDFDEDLSHLIEAGSDIFLMPSKYEPCGLSQLSSLKYGSVPVVRKTGGLADTISDFDEKTGKGTGFIFEKYDAKDFLSAIQRALSYYEQPKIWKKIVKNGMKQDFSWKSSAKDYSKVYEKILKR